MKTLLSFCLVGLLLSPACEHVLSAADHMNLENGLPLQIEDAYPVAYRGREIQSVFRYDHTRKNEDRLLIAPQLEFGILPNTELTIRAPFILGDASRSGSGDIEIEGLYNFTTETVYVPAFALEAGGVIPTGKDSDGFDTALTFIVTKSITQSGSDRIHFNATWGHNAAPLHSEREDIYRLVAGYSRRIAADWVLLADLVREQEHERDEESNMIEVGVRWQLTPLSVVSFGAGPGIGDESPKARAILGFQHSF